MVSVQKAESEWHKTDRRGNVLRMCVTLLCAGPEKWCLLTGGRACCGTCRVP